MRRASAAAVRFSLVLLALGSFGTAFMGPVEAGSLAAPEIADPANDQAIGGVVPISSQPASPTTTVGLNADLLFGWIDSESPESLQLNLKIQGTGAGTTSSTTLYVFHLETGGKGYNATAKMALASPAGTGTPTAGGVAASATIGGGLVTMVVPKANIGSPPPGAVLSNLFATAEGRSADLGATITDRAPNTGAGTNYTTAGGGGGTVTNPNDTDADGLNDTWERQYFNSTTAQNASGDPDGDGLTNGQEQALGTDPTKADTDGDGVNDNNDPFPLDPTQGGSSNSTSSNSTTTTTTSSKTTTTTGGNTTSQSSSTTSSGSSTSEAPVRTLGDAIEKLKSDLGYLGGSAGGLIAVLVLCILALSVRWSL